MNNSNKQATPSALGKMAKQCVEDSERWFGDSNVVYSIPHHTLAMLGEAGEFANIVKKIERGSLDVKDAKVRMMLANELTDVFVYMLNIAALLNIDLEKSYMMVRANNERRFTEERSRRASSNGHA